MADQATRGGTHEQHVKAGEQSHKNTASGAQDRQAGGSPRGGSHEQGKAGEQSRNNTSGGAPDQQTSGSSRGGSHDQHVKAGEQSHKNS